MKIPWRILVLDGGWHTNKIIKMLISKSKGSPPAQRIRGYFEISSNHYGRIRSLVVLAALLVLYFRVPTYFSYPQFWAEDGLAYMQTHVAGIKSLAMPMAGYLLVVLHVITLLAALFPTSATPVIYFYSTVVVTLAVVWLVMSPRFDIPFRPLAALAIVTSYQGIYTLGGVANLQWILPIGACAIIFMRPARSRMVFTGELIFLALMSLTGPFSILLTPLIALRLLIFKSIRTSRQIAFALVIAAGAQIQTACMLINLDATLLSGDHAPVTASTIINMPFHQLFTPIGSSVFSGPFGVVATIGISICIAWFALRAPYKMEKIFIVMFSFTLFMGAMIKSGIDLDENYGLRYFYIPSVFAVWFVAFATASIPFPNFVAASLVAFQSLLAGFAFNSGLIKGNFEWSVWSSAIESGLPVTFPVSPSPWTINIPASAIGPFHSLNTWTGKLLDSVTTVASRRCAGTVLTLETLVELNFANVSGVAIYDGAVPRWRIKGETSFADMQLVVMTDWESRVLGFGYVGFLGNPGMTTWIGIVPGVPNDTMKIFGVGSAGKDVCLLTEITLPALSK